ncbi:MAG TPA: NAD(P)(+) transhydrogenase (Re/Si-specific) subunit alpha, partial [Planctomycetota bacterium]|nr:NAD(P)(+) transhydrogenase (Re/Si-specific) subunit alpha [Planctomycetota bacterium]
MIVGIPTELDPSEKRVAATPRTVVRLCKMGFDVIVEKGAGHKAEHHDQQYIEAGARLVESGSAVYQEADIVLKVNAPTLGEA